MLIAQMTRRLHHPLHTHPQLAPPIPGVQATAPQVSCIMVHHLHLMVHQSSPPTSPVSPNSAQFFPINSSSQVGQSPPTNLSPVEQSPSPPSTPLLNTPTDPLVRQADDLLHSLRCPIPSSQDHPVLLQFSQPVYSPKDEELPPIYPSPVSPPTPVTASQISRIITEVRNNPAVSHPQSNSNPQPRDSHTTGSPPGPEPSASERAKNMRQCFTTDTASLLGRSLSEAECLR